MAKRGSQKLQVAFAAAARPGKGGGQDEADEHRGFPRIETPARFSIWIGEGSDRRFAASLQAVNLSVSGAFLQSSFFLPIRTELRVSFVLDEAEEPVLARAQIVREERADSRSASAKTGFGIRFLEFYGQTEVTLAKLFLGEQLRSFVQQYLQSKRARSLGSELERTVDSLAAWELLRITTPRDPWDQPAPNSSTRRLDRRRPRASST